MTVANLISGKDSTGVERVVLVGTDGSLTTTGGGGGGGAGDASAANQTLQITAANSTNTKLDTLHTDLGTIDGHVDGLETLVTSSNTKLDTLHTDSAAILAKLLTAPATEAKQDTGNTSLSNLDANAGAVTDAAVAAGATGSISAKLRAISRDIIANIVLKAGSAIIGQVGVDQTTPGTTDSVTVKASAGIGSLTEGAPASDTASSGLNGRLQRIAQRLTTIIAGLIVQPLNATPAWTNIGANNTDGIASMDVSNYRLASIQLTGTWTATVRVQFSNDGGTTWVDARGFGTGGIVAISMGGTGTYYYPIPAVALMRIRTTAYTSGSVVGNVTLTSLPAINTDINITNTTLATVGSVTSAAADSGAPVKTGGKYNSTKPTFTDGQRGDTQIEINGAATAAMYGKVTNPGDTPLIATASGRTKVSILGSAVGDAATVVGVVDDSDVATRALAAGVFYYNGANADRVRGMFASTVLASAARTATVSTDVTNFNGKTIAVTLNITAAPNTASTITLQIRLKDSISGNYTTLLASAAIVGTATTGVVPVTNLYRVGGGITVTANISAADVLGRTMNVNVVHSNSDSWTYSVSADIGI